MTVGDVVGDAYVWVGQGSVTDAGAGEHNSLIIMCKYNVRIVVLIASYLY